MPCDGPDAMLVSVSICPFRAHQGPLRAGFDRLSVGDPSAVSVRSAARILTTTIPRYSIATQIGGLFRLSAIRRLAKVSSAALIPASSRNSETFLCDEVAANADGLKVGGRQASSASVVTLMTALYMDVLALAGGGGRGRARCVREQAPAGAVEAGTAIVCPGGARARRARGREEGLGVVSVH